MNSFISVAMGKVIPQQFFYKDGFGIKTPTKVDRPLNKEMKQNEIKLFQF